MGAVSFMLLLLLSVGQRWPIDVAGGLRLILDASPGARWAHISRLRLLDGLVDQLAVKTG